MVYRTDKADRHAPLAMRMVIASLMSQRAGAKQRRSGSTAQTNPARASALINRWHNAPVVWRCPPASCKR